MSGKAQGFTRRALDPCFPVILPKITGIRSWTSRIWGELSTMTMV
jgi:hypothetical protein